MDGRGRGMDNIFIERLWRSLKYEDVSLHEMGQRHPRCPHAHSRTSRRSLSLRDRKNNKRSQFQLRNRLRTVPPRRSISARRCELVTLLMVFRAGVGIGWRIAPNGGLIDSLVDAPVGGTPQDAAEAGILRCVRRSNGNENIPHVATRV